MNLNEDVSIFFEEFAEPATWKGSVSVNVIFDNAYQLAGGFVESTNPVIIGQASEFTGVAQDDAITLRGVDYTVQTVEFDAPGAILVMQLEKS